MVGSSYEGFEDGALGAAVVGHDFDFFVDAGTPRYSNAARTGTRSAEFAVADPSWLVGAEWVSDPDPDTGSGTMSAWVRLDSNGIRGSGNPVTGPARVTLTAACQVPGAILAHRIRFVGAGSVAAIYDRLNNPTGVTVTLGAWYRLGCTWDAAAMVTTLSTPSGDVLFTETYPWPTPPTVPISTSFGLLVESVSRGDLLYIDDLDFTRLPFVPLVQAARPVTRLYPRDDAAGLSSAPRIHPPPRARRIIGGHL